MQPRDRHQLDQRWRRVQRAARRRLLVHGLVSWLALAGTVGLLVIVVLGATEPPRWVVRGVVTTAAVLIGSAAWSLLVPAWRRLRTRARLARQLDRAGGFQDTLAATDEALVRPERWTADTPVRAALLDRLLARGARLLADLDLARLLPVGRPWLAFGSLAAALVAGGVLDVVAPDLTARGWQRAVSAWSTPPVASGGLQLAPGAGHVLLGESRTVAVFDLVAVESDPVVCEVRRGTGAWRPLPARPVPAGVATPGLPEPFERWEADLRDVREDLAYRFRRGRRVSGVRELVVWRPPLLSELAARIEPPAYTQLGARDVPRLPAYLEVPQGSRLVLAGRASTELSAAAVVEDSLTTALSVAGDRVAGALVMQAPRRFQLQLTDARGLVGADELTHEVAVIPDRPPLVSLQRPDDDGRLPLAVPLALRAEAEDDYGLVGVDLLVRRGAAGGGAWVADLPGQGQRSDDEGWERVPLLTGTGALVDGRREVALSLGRLALVVTDREAADAGVVSADLSLAVGQLALVPGDVLELALEARDNRQPPPPGRARSAVLRLEVPSSLDLLAARDEAAGQHRADLEAMRRQSADVSAQLERLRRELLKNPLLDWDRRQELQAALERQDALQDELQRLADSLGQDLEQLAESRLTSPELQAKMDRIEELLANQQNQSLEALLESLRQSLDQMSPNELNRAMDDLVKEQTELRRRLDTAMAMLADLAREQEMEGLTDMVAQMLAEQQDLAEASRQEAQAPADEPRAGDENQGDQAEGDQAEGDQAEGDQAEGDQSPDQPADTGEQPEAGKPTPQEQARRQQALADELQALQEKLEETLAELEQSAQEKDPSAAEQQMQEALAEALEQLAKQRTSQTMQDAGESLKQKRSQQATEQQQQALTDLAGLYHVMLRTQVAMQMAMQAEQAGQMRDVAADLLALSQRQEDVGQDVPLSLREIRAEQLARRQYEVLQGTAAVRDALGAVAGAAPQEILRMLKNLDGLIETQGDVLEQLKERRSRSAREAATRSLAGMNELVISLLTQAQQTGEGGGSGQPQPMLSQQLRQMSEQQSGLNALAEQLRRQQGGLSQELRAGMQRLQQGQQGLAGQARQLAEEQRQLERAGESGRLLGDLDALARDMESVGDDLGGGLVTPEVLRRQDRILSRLLDMHNASRERDWARRRESRSADEVYAEQPGVAGPAREDADPEARRWRAVEDAPPAYRDLVRRYFREIQRLHQEAGRLDDGRLDERRRGGL
ncbi:MAG: DUF4175 family protein [Candidatus Krumholzibacteriia bacterium]